MDLLTVVSSHLDQVVCLHYSILPSATSRCVDEWLNIRRKLTMHFNHNYIQISAYISQVYFDGLSILMAVPVTIIILNICSWFS